MTFTSAEFIVCSLVQTPMCWKWKENSISISSSTGHICISLSMYTCVGVNQCRCYYDNSEMQLQTGISHETLCTLPVSFPSCACAELMSGHKSYNIPFPCGWLIYHLQATSSWLYSFCSYLNTNNCLAQHRRVCDCVCICHTAPCRGLT